MPLRGVEYLEQIPVSDVSARRHWTSRRNVDVQQTGCAEVSAGNPELLSNISEECCRSNVLVELDGIKAKPRLIQ